MKTTNLTAKFLLITTLFASNALAEEGQMNGGGKTCNPQVQTCLREEPSNEPDSKTDSTTDSATDSTTNSTTDSMFDFIKDYLVFWII